MNPSQKHTQTHRLHMQYWNTHTSSNIDITQTSPLLIYCGSFEKFKAFNIVPWFIIETLWPLKFGTNKSQKHTTQLICL